MSSGGSASLRWALLLIFPAFLLITCRAEEDVHATPLKPHGVRLLLHRVLRWRERLRSSGEKELKLDAPTVAAAVLCLASAAISSAGGIGGGALFVPVLHLLAGLGLKTATSFSAFMVTGGATSNVLYSMCFKGYIDYDIALLLQPCMLLGVTLGVICNVVFPEWLVALLFVMLLAWSTFKTCRSGVMCWAGESKAKRERFCTLESAGEGEAGPKDGAGRKGTREPLLGVDAAIAQSTRPSWKKMVTLVAIWMSFFLLQSLRGGKGGKGVIEAEKCGVAYWLITFSQAPLALLFTAYLLYGQSGAFHDHNKDQLGDLKGEFLQVETGPESFPKIIFPAAALLSGVLGGLFGIGGGLLMSPVLLQIGVPPQTTAATSSFMVLFSASMSSVQYLMLGMEGVKAAAGLAAGCFVASLVGLIVIQRAVSRLGRASLIIFTVSTVMLLSMVSMTCFGAVDVWRDYVDGKYMGFKLPC